MCVWIKDFLSNRWQAVRLTLLHQSVSQHRGTPGLRPQPLPLLPLHIGLTPKLFFFFFSSKTAGGCLPRCGCSLTISEQTLTPFRWYRFDTNTNIDHAYGQELCSPPRATITDTWDVSSPSCCSSLLLVSSDVPCCPEARATLMLPYFSHFPVCFSALARQVSAQTHAPSVRSHKMRS